MKNIKANILPFVIGILIGAIITTSVFLIIRSNRRPNIPDFDKSGFPMKRDENGEGSDFDKFDKKDFDRKRDKANDKANIEENN